MSKVQEIELSEEEYWCWEDCFNVFYIRIHLDNGEVILEEGYDQDPRYPFEYNFSTIWHARRFALEKARGITGESYWSLWRKIKIYNKY